MSLRLQDPEDASSPYLLEALLDACRGATSGFGLFAWATATGLELLLRDPTFVRFTASHPFELLVGLDLVTDERALNAMRAIAADAPNFRARVFLHKRTSSLFHPKTSWFRRKDGSATLLAGSGNLTLGGLRANWEAFSVTELTNAQTQELEAHWRGLVDRHAAKILAPGDEEAIARAAQNTGWDSRPRAKPPETPLAGVSTELAPSGGPVQVVEAVIEELIAPDSPVLIAEIPRAADRWNQANFDLATYEGFFGAKVGTQRRILLQHVDRDGTLAPIERRPSVEVKSRNFRFELQAASGIPYPVTGRPVAVFVRQLTGVFLYRLVLPSDADYGAVTKLLDDIWKGRSDRMRRVITTADVLEKYWASAPFWKVTSTPE